MEGESTGRKSYRTLADEYSKQWLSATKAKQDELRKAEGLVPEPEPEGSLARTSTAEFREARERDRKRETPEEAPTPSRLPLPQRSGTPPKRSGTPPTTDSDEADGPLISAQRSPTPPRGQQATGSSNGTATRSRRPVSPPKESLRASTPRREDMSKRAQSPMATRSKGSRRPVSPPAASLSATATSPSQMLSPSATPIHATASLDSAASQPRASRRGRRPPSPPPHTATRATDV